MGEVIKHTRYAFLGIILLLTSSCVKDGLEPCPDPDGEYYSYIRFIYDYNMSFEDLFHNQVSSIDLYLFDDNGTFIEKISDECSNGATFPKGYLMGIPEAYKEVTQFVAFPGVRQELLTATKMLPGISTIADLEVSLNKLQKESIVNTQFESFWNGNITYTRTKVDRNDTTVISLTKNTNTLRVVLQLLDENEGEKLDINEFSIRLKTTNSAYSAYNDIINDTPWMYHPHYTANDNDEVTAVAELSTLRLMEDRENRLKIEHDSSLEAILDINLNKYINALKLQEYNNMSLQEYMDREDTYKLIIFLKKTDGFKQKWMAAQISINDWIVRDQNGEL